MKKFQLIGILFLLVSLSTFGQSNEWKSLNKDAYSIQYPNKWELNETELMGTSFILFSQLSSKKDQFRENVNLIIQDLTGHNIDLNQYVEISENQVKTMITDSNIILSERIKKDGNEFQKIIYTGKQGIFNLKFEQYYWIHNNVVYVLTLTCEVTEYDFYKETGEGILNSFKLK